MPDQPVPATVRALADARALARAGREWAEADRLRAEIEAAGWKVVDRGFSYSLASAHPPDLVEGAVVRYGRSASVPSRLAEPASGLATIVLVATDWPEDLARAVAGLAANAPEGTAVVVVADGPSPEQDEALARLVESLAAADRPGLDLEIVRTSARLGQASALNIGIRRAGSATVVVLDTSIEPTGDIVTPLVRALEDPRVAVAGARGVVSGDLRHFREAPGGEADAIERDCQAFRRDDAARRGPLDERFRVDHDLGIWWSLVLRDEGDGAEPRRAVVVSDLPFARHEQRTDASLPPAERDRLARRNVYRLIERFGRRTELLLEPTDRTLDR